MHKDGGRYFTSSTCKNYLEFINGVVIKGVAIPFSVGGGGGVEATD